MKNTVKALKEKVPYRSVCDLRDGEGCCVFLDEHLIFYDTIGYEHIIENVPIPMVQNWHKVGKPYAYIEQNDEGLVVYVDAKFTSIMVDQIHNTARGNIKDALLIDELMIVVD